MHPSSQRSFSRCSDVRATAGAPHRSATAAGYRRRVNIPVPVERFVEFLLSFGERSAETDVEQGKRRVIVTALWIGIFITPVTVLLELRVGQYWVAVGNIVVIAVLLTVQIAIRTRPLLLAPAIHIAFGVAYVVQLIETALLGGLTQTGLAVVFGLLFVVASLVAFSLRAAAWWFAAFVASLVYAVLVPNWVDLVYEVAGPGPDGATNLVALSIVVFAVIAYFVRERDRLQKESDDLLHNILPEEITARLKREPGLIADSFNAASVLFADVVGFTPMSAGMSPTELVGLLNSVFSTFDRFVDQLALEKIKTVGDEYMVASGVPLARPDHAEAIAELAFWIRDHVATNRFGDHRIDLRIGINSGPVGCRDHRDGQIRIRSVG